MKRILISIFMMLAALAFATPHNQLYNDPVNTGLHGLHVPGFNTGTHTQRLSYPTGSLYVSDQWFESDTLITYQWNGLTWNQIRVLGTDTPSYTPTPTFTPTITVTPTNTFTATNSPTCASSWTPGCGNQGTFTPTPTQTCASSWTPGCGNQGTATFTNTPTFTPTQTLTPTFTPTFTPGFVFHQRLTYANSLTPIVIVDGRITNNTSVVCTQFDLTPVSTPMAIAVTCVSGSCTIQCNSSAPSTWSCVVAY